jgi:hypothetical protein
MYRRAGEKILYIISTPGSFKIVSQYKPEKESRKTPVFATVSRRKSQARPGFQGNTQSGNLYKKGKIRSRRNEKDLPPSLAERGNSPFRPP